MIHTAKQLKDKVKNMSGGNSEVAQALIRTYFMERFLERVSVSEYRNNFILKGGMLVASIVAMQKEQAIEKATEEYRKYQVQNLSPVEEEYLESIKNIHSTVKKNGKNNFKGKL